MTGVARGAFVGRPDRGSGSVLVLGVVALLVVVTVGALCIASAVEAGHRARLAADLAALAGADAMRPGLTGPKARGSGCAEAAAVANANGAVLRRCSVHGPDLEVLVAVPVRWGAGQAVARAVAGPATRARGP